MTYGVSIRPNTIFFTEQIVSLWRLFWLTTVSSDQACGLEFDRTIFAGKGIMRTDQEERNVKRSSDANGKKGNDSSVSDYHCGRQNRIIQTLFKNIKELEASELPRVWRRHRRPSLNISRLPRRRSVDRLREFTRPFHTRGQVPFAWEQGPGKPKRNFNTVPDDHITSSSPICAINSHADAERKPETHCAPGELDDNQSYYSIPVEGVQRSRRSSGDSGARRSRAKLDYHHNPFRHFVLQTNTLNGCPDEVKINPMFTEANYSKQDVQVERRISPVSYRNVNKSMVFAEAEYCSMEQFEDHQTSRPLHKIVQ
eukprot:Gb_07318 [translate_table: standard]